MKEEPTKNSILVCYTCILYELRIVINENLSGSELVERIRKLRTGQS